MTNGFTVSEDTVMDRSTIDYYNTHALEYALKTRYVVMWKIRSAFLKYIDPNGRIADLGCGGGRDKKIFEENGYWVDACDASPEMCRIAAEFTEDKIECCDLMEWSSRFSYGGIWCSSSLVHLTEDEFFAFFQRVKKYLGSGGVIYFSMKKDVEDGYDEFGRYYLGFTEERLKRILTENKDLMRAEYWETEDNLNRNLVWKNVILKKR